MDANMFFFTDNHCFGNGQLPSGWVPCSQSFPLMVTPREGLEDGVIDTIEKFVSVFESDAKQITSMDELLEILNKVREEIPEQVKVKPFYKKEKKTWNTGHFPVGTIAKAKLHNEEEFEFTVKEVVCNGPRSYVIVTDLPHDLTDDKSFNMSYVTSIVKRGDGSEYKNTGSAAISQMFRDSIKDGYVSARILILFTTSLYVKPDMLIDIDNFIIELFKQGVLRKNSSYDLVYNKKKLRKAVKRLLNKFLVKHKTAEREQQEMYSKWVEDDWDGGWNESDASGFDEGVGADIHHHENSFVEQSGSEKSLGNGDDNYDGLGNSSLIDHENSPWLDDHHSSFNRELLSSSSNPNTVESIAKTILEEGKPDLESDLNKKEYLHDSSLGDNFGI
jgi:hypothetical protein